MAKTRIMLRRHEGATVSMIAAPTGEVATLATWQPWQPGKTFCR